MADRSAQAQLDLAIANRIVSHRGHHRRLRPRQHAASDQAGPLSDFALALARGGRAADIYEYTLDSEPVKPLPNGIRGYGELVIHGEIYKARPDVNAVAHHHGMAFLPFCNTGKKLDAALSHGRADRREGAVLGQPRRVRRHLPAGAQAGGRPLAGEGARPELAGADAPPWRHGRGEDAENSCSARIYSYRNAELQLMAEARASSAR